MKLSYKGFFKNNEQLPKGELPANAVKFKEPDDMVSLSVVSSLFLFPALFGVIIIAIFSYLLHGELYIGFTLIGTLAAVLCMIPHELLHAVCFGKKAEVELYVAPKQLSLFVVSAQPISKARFIFLSLLPNLVFGWIPLVVWAVLPHGGFGNHLFTFAIISIMFGAGDYMNSFNALRQMPKGSLQQISGFNSYWFMPEEKQVKNE